MRNPIKALTKREWILWLGSLAVVAASQLAAPQPDGLTLAATLIGTTALLFGAKGHILAQILNILFSILYGILSFRFHYWGEMLTYWGMTLPMAVWSLITWYRHPSGEDEGAVEIQHLNRWQLIGVTTGSAAVTGGFYWLLSALHTPNLAVSTLSVTTSFFAAALTMLRSSYYALGYAANDAVLIVLWILASRKDPAYLPVVINFCIFLLNDLYGFASWKKRERRQREQEGPLPEC